MTNRARRVRGHAAALLLATFALAATPMPGAARAERGWVRGEIRLNLRTGPGTQYRILGVSKTGDGVEVLERGADWTKIRLAEGGVEGWIPQGYLQPEPPPALSLAKAEARTESLQSQLSSLEEETRALREKNGVLSSQDEQQQQRIEQLSMQNMKLRAGTRYVEWITGASILTAGMILGALLHRNTSRRQPSRIRL